MASMVLEAYGTLSNISGEFIAQQHAKVGEIGRSEGWRQVLIASSQGESSEILPQAGAVGEREPLTRPLSRYSL